MRGIVSDRDSPIAYGFDAQLPVYFNQDPGAERRRRRRRLRRRRRRRRRFRRRQNITPMATVGDRLSPWDPEDPVGTRRAARRRGAVARGGGRGRRGGGRGGGGGGGGFGGGAAETRAARRDRQFPSNPDDMLLSGTLDGGEALANRAQVVDAPIGKGHVVMFAIRPFWRWQTQGTTSSASTRS